MKLGIAGYAGSGKDEVAKILESEFDFERIGMSDALHEYMLALNPIIVPYPLPAKRYSDVIDEYGFVETKARYPEVRDLLQRLGTEVGRAIDPYMWVKERDKRITKPNCVTTGIRFMEEIEYCDFIIWVSRDGFGPVNSHVSDDIAWIQEHSDLTIYNNGTLEDLHDNVCRSMTAWTLTFWNDINRATFK